MIGTAIRNSTRGAGQCQIQVNSYVIALCVVVNTAHLA